MDRSAFTYSDYTIGWVCALGIEQTAALMMLDKTHPSLPPISHDDNTYTLGQIGNHFVVIVCLPKGKVGNSESAACVKSMVMAFGNIRIALMVGIGGSISKKVKLGDIVVSTPKDVFPGVVQWDLGKETDEGFRRTGSLDSPPKAVLTAVSKLESLHEIRDQVKFPEYLGAALSRLREDWARPDNSKQPSQVHYGTIASGNAVIKAQSRRAEIVKKLGGDILCVEMEAAGVMSTFASLVVRGICDCADENKNDIWQKHAALVAAAYIKDLLLAAVVPSMVQIERSFRNRLLDSRLYAPYVLHRLRAENQRFEEVPEADEHTFHWVLPREEEENRLQALKRKAEDDFISQRQRKDARDEITFHKEHLEQRRTQLSDWLSKGSGIMHIAGKPGSGKSCLMKFIVQNEVTYELLRDWAHPRTLCVAKFFLWRPGDTKQNTISDLIRGLLHSMVGWCTNLAFELFPQITELDLDTARLQTSIVYTDTEVRQAFKRLTQIDAMSDQYKFCFFIDGLDEIAKASEHSQLVEQLQLWTGGPRTNTKVFVSSRELPVFQRLQVSGRLRLHDLTPFDIKRFIQHKLKAPNGFQTGRADLIQEFSDEIADRADGVFLWADLVLRSLNEGFTNGDSEQLLLVRLKELPQELDELFDHLLQSIEKRYQPSALLLILLAMQRYGYRIDDNSEDLKSQGMQMLHISLGMRKFNVLRVFHSHILFNEIDRTAVYPQTTATDWSQCFTVHNTTKTRSPVSERPQDLNSGIVLAARCKGLLEIVKAKGDKDEFTIEEYLGGTITFYHRSIPEYLLQKGKLKDMAHGIGLTDSLVLLAMIWIVWKHAQCLTEPTNDRLKWRLWNSRHVHSELESFVYLCLQYLDRRDYEQEESIRRAFKLLQKYDFIMHSYSRSVSSTGYISSIPTSETSAINIAVRYGFVQYTRQYSRPSWLFDPEYNQELQRLIIAAMEGHRYVWNDERLQVRESARQQAEILNHLWNSRVQSTYEHVDNPSSVMVLDFDCTDLSLLDYIWLTSCRKMVDSNFLRNIKNPQLELRATHQSALIEELLRKGAVPQAVAHFEWEYEGNTKVLFPSLKVTCGHKKEIRHIIYPMALSAAIKSYLRLLLYYFEGMLTFEKMIFMWGTWFEVPNISNILARLDTNLEREISSGIERIPSMRNITEAHVRKFGVYEASNLVKIGQNPISGTRKLPEDLAAAARPIEPGLSRVVGLPKKDELDLDSMALSMGVKKQMARIVSGYIDYISSRNEALNEARQHSARGKHTDAVELQHRTGDDDDMDINSERPVKRRRIHD